MELEFIIFALINGLVGTALGFACILYHAKKYTDQAGKGETGWYFVAFSGACVMVCTSMTALYVWWFGERIAWHALVVLFGGILPYATAILSYQFGLFAISRIAYKMLKSLKYDAMDGDEADQQIKVEQQYYGQL